MTARSVDDRYFLSAGLWPNDTIVRLFRNNGAFIRQHPSSDGYPTAVAIAPDDSTYIIVYPDKKILVYSLLSGSLLKTYTGETNIGMTAGEANSAIGYSGLGYAGFTPDGTTLAVARTDNVLAGYRNEFRVAAEVAPVTLSASQVVSGQSLTATVGLTQAAPVQGVPVWLKYDSGLSGSTMLSYTSGQVRKPVTVTAGTVSVPKTVNFEVQIGNRTPVQAPFVTILPNNKAAYVSQANVPLTMAAGSTATVRVTMRNSGTSTWSTANGHRLSENAGTDWGIADVPLPGTQTTGPGGSRTFTFTIKAPSTPGVYPFQWRMRQIGVGSFGAQNLATSITVY
jgi:hypothetical protein